MCSVLRISVFATVVVATLAIGPKSVHVSLDTRIHINPEDSNSTYKVINKISNFLHKIKYALTTALKDQIASRRTQKPKYLTNFLNDVARVILNFGGKKTGLFFKTLYHEIKGYFENKGSVINYIVNNAMVREYLLAKLKDWSEANPLELKTKLRKYMDRVKNKYSALIKLGLFLNYYYTQEHEEKMREYVRKLKNCKKESDFAMVIREAMLRLVIQHYSIMNYTMRTRITDEINILSERFIQRRFITVGIKTNSTKKENIISKNKSSSPVKSTTTVFKNYSINVNTKTEHKNTTGNNTVPEKQNDVSSDIEVPKQTNNGTSRTSYVPVYAKPETSTNQSVDIKFTENQNLPLDIKLKSDSNKKNAVTDEYKKSVTKRRLRKLPTTTHYVPEVSTPMILKRFSLKYPKEDNGTSMTNITSVPIIITNGTQNQANVPRAIDDVTKNSSQTISNSITSPTFVPQVITQNIKNVTSMKMIPVPQDIHKKVLRVATKFDKSPNITGLRVIDVDFDDHTQRPRRGKYTDSLLLSNLRFSANNFVPEVKVFVNTDNPWIGNRKKTFTQTEIMDIEDRIDAMHIDGK